MQTSSRSKAWISEFGPVSCGRIVELSSDGQACVDFPGNGSGPIVARCLDTVRLESRTFLADLPILLVFEHGDPAKPIIVGVVDSGAAAQWKTHGMCVPPEKSQHAIVDGRRLMLKGEEEVTLVCGEASITLTKDGRITLRGVEIVSRALGSNKIRGASVSIN